MYIYKIVDLKTGKTYVGKTVKACTERWQQHCTLLKKKKHHNKQLQRIYNKDPNRLIFEIVQDCITDLEQLNLLEVYYISKIGSLNMTKGGDGGDTLSKHPDKANISAKMKANRHQAKGVENHNYKVIPKEVEEGVVRLWKSLIPPTIKEVAETVNLTRYIVRRVLNKYGVVVPSRIETQKALIDAGKLIPNKKGVFTEEQKDLIVKLYLEDWISCVKIGQMFKLRGESAILKVLRERNVKLRSKREWTTYNNSKRFKQYENC